jgi:hypothetical protein
VLAAGIQMMKILADWHETLLEQEFFARRDERAAGWPSERIHHPPLANVRRREIKTISVYLKVTA